MSEAGLQAPTKNRRIRRTRAQIDADNAASLRDEAPSPVTRAASRTSQFVDEEGNELTRRSKRGGGKSDFDIPANLRKPGWDYEWKTKRVLGQDVDASDMVDIFEGGWRPVKASAMRQMCPPGWGGEHVERRGQILYTRPTHLTEEAKREDYDRAETQKQDKLRAALAGPSDLTKHTNRTVEKFEVTGEVGMHDQKR